MMRLLLVLLLLAACSPPARTGDNDAPVCGSPRVTGRLGSELSEASGITAHSARNDLVWAINDDGPPVLFALDSSARVVTRVEVRGAQNRDWESLAGARCAGGSCIYIGDIGDNLRERRVLRVYRVPEPAAGDRVTEQAVAFELRFPDGSHDAEAMFVLPSQQLYIVTKGRSEPISVYRSPGPLTSDSTVTLQLVQTLSPSFVQLPDMVTGAGATPDGRHIVLRTYSAVQLYDIRADTLHALLPPPGLSLQALREYQGEGVDIRSDGTVLLLSEKGLDEGQPPLSRVECRF